ncbi:MAG: prepilin-type N-terminal cleavage/methylation domain-containing protein [Pseudanabaena sp. ELA645]|jgi:prepilin-type N-terminal cleavage/methylation domain-containing protein
MMFSIRKLFRRDRFKSQHGDRKLGDQKFARTPSRTMRRMMQRSRGFTLIELLMAMLITTIIVGTLLSFVVNITETDRTEQAKSESQGEVQTALSYISNDLQEAIYIYNADALNADSTATTNKGIRDLLPSFNDSIPVLVFWKRVYYETTDEMRVDPANTSTKKMVGCLEYGTSTTNVAAPTTPPTFNASCPIVNGTPQGSGKYAYSLVAYYLTYDGDSTWSKAARVGRWELRDGIIATCQSKNRATCAEPKPIQQVNLNADGSSYINYWTVPDTGFRPFSTSGADIQSVMTPWTTSIPTYDLSVNKLTTLIDFLDDTPYTATQDDGTVGNSPIDIAIRGNATNVDGKTINVDCSNPNIGVGVVGDSTDPKLQIAQRSPQTFKTTSANDAETLTSFYVCVNSTQTAARIYLRSNVLARLRPNLPIAQRPVSNQTTNLSTGNIRAYGRGKLSLQ